MKWTFFPLHPETPDEGLSLETLFAGRIDTEQIMSRLRLAAQEAGLPYGNREMTYNSRLAQELAKWAESKGKEKEFHWAVFEAYFVHGMNIGDISILEKLVRRIGLSGEEAGEILRQRRFKEDVDSDWIRSRQMGIQAVPSFSFENRVLVGALPYEKITAFVEAAGVKKRA